jgi:peptidoglycan/xylan/chitin deacetylase (PgdA/CDA1 family)/O-antigen ligase
LAARLDRVGLTLLVAFVGWSLVSAAAAGGNPVPPVLVAVVAAIAVALGRRFGRGDIPAAPAAVVVLVLGAALVSVDGLMGAAGDPLRYGNANAALYLQAGAAGLMLFVGSSRPGVRVAGAGAAGAFGLLVVLTGSVAGLALLAGPLLAALLPPGRAVRIGVAAAAAVMAVAALATVTLAAIEPSPDRRPPERGIRRATPVERTDRRPDRERATGRSGLAGRRDLWREAYLVMAAHPVTGVGPGGFVSTGPGTRRDPDLRWAHHEFLQEGAETGAPGLVLLVLAFLWGFARLVPAPPDRVTALGAASLAVLGVHASLDYVLHFPAIPAAAAVLLGTAQGRGDRAPRSRLGGAVRKAAKVAVLPLGLVSPRRPDDLVVLLYHRVGRGGREIDLSRAAFEHQVAALAETGRVVTLDDALSDGGGVVLTFDDGYRDFTEHVVPVLARHRVPAHLYLATGLVVEEGGDREDGMTWAQLREAVGDALVTVGSHTHRHLNLGSVGEPEAVEEMRRSKGLIEERLAVPCRHFAYPWGVGSPAADRAARGLFESAALRWATNRGGRIDRYRLGRTPVLRSDGSFLFSAKLRGLLDGESMLYRLAGRGPWGP